MQNIISVIFENESDGYQMITELRQEPVSEQAAILQMALVKCDEGGLTLHDQYEGIARSAGGTVIGGLTGSLIGILGGPFGMLLMGTSGALMGRMADVGGAVAGEALLETVASKLVEGDAALIILAEEEDESYLDAKISKFPAEILRYDALDIADEVDEAIRIQSEMNRQARMQLRQSRKDAQEAYLKEKHEARKAELEADFEEYKKNLQL